MRTTAPLDVVVVLALPLVGGCASQQQPPGPVARLTLPVDPPVLPAPGRASATVEVEDIAAPYDMEEWSTNRRLQIHFVS